MNRKLHVIDDREPVHEWFELSYAQYLTIPRSVLQSMPSEWQARFAQCLDELDELIDWRPPSGRYWVELRDGNGRFASDPLMDYERGRRRIPLREPYLSFADALTWLRKAVEKTAVRVCVILPDKQRDGEYIKQAVVNHFKYHAATTGGLFGGEWIWLHSRSTAFFPNGAGIHFVSLVVPGDRDKLHGAQFDHLLVHHTAHVQVEQMPPLHSGDYRIFFDR